MHVMVGCTYSLHGSSASLTLLDFLHSLLVVPIAAGLLRFPVQEHTTIATAAKDSKEMTYEYRLSGALDWYLYMLSKLNP